jgi:hypothetical protein
LELEGSEDGRSEGGEGELTEEIHPEEVDLTESDEEETEPEEAKFLKLTIDLTQKKNTKDHRPKQAT